MAAANDRSKISPVQISSDLMFEQSGDLRAAIEDLLLEPPNPFDKRAKRKPRRGAALFGGLALLLVVVFIVSSLIAE